MSKETVKVVEIDTNPAVKSLKDLRKELLELKNQMANLDEGSDAFRETARKAGEVKHQIDEINESVKGASSDFGDMVGNVTNVAAGITGAFQAVAGGLQALGVESKAIDEAIARMQGLMAVTQGLSAIDDGIKSFKKLTTAINVSSKGLGGFKKALIGTGLGALVVVLGSIIANWDEFSKSIGISEQAMNKFGDVMKGVLNSALSTIGGVGKAISRLITGDFKGAGEAIKDGFALQKNFTEGVKKSEEERTKKEREEAAERKKIAQEEAQKKIDEQNRLLNEYRAKEQEKIDIELERLKRSGKTESEQLEEQIRLEQERLKFIEDGTLAYEQQLTKVHELKQELTELNTPKEEKKKEEKKKEEKPQKLEIDTENDKLKELAKGYYTLEETATETFNRISEELALALERDLITQEQYDIAVKNLAKERARFVAQQSVQTFAAAANMITTLLDGIADQQDTNSREGFEKSKKLQIASATIQMLNGIVNAISTSMGLPQPFGAIMAGINAATVATAGAMNINKIKQQTFDGGGASASVSSGAVSNTIIPPVQYSNSVQFSETNGAIQNQRVYVLESDITNTTKAVVTQSDENTY